MVREASPLGIEFRMKAWWMQQLKKWNMCYQKMEWKQVEKDC